MNILLAVIVALIAIGHTASAFFDGIACRIIMCVTVLLHPTALFPMLVMKLPFEAVALLFLGSALYYLIITLARERFFKKRAPSDMGGDEN